MLIRSPLLEFDDRPAGVVAAAPVGVESLPLLAALKSIVSMPSRDMIAFMFSGWTQAGRV